MLRGLKAVLIRDVRLAGRIGGGAAMSLLFFLCVLTLTPFAIGPDLRVLARIGPATLWVAALLATLLGLDRLFQVDEDDGSLDLFIGAEAPLEAIVAVKCLAHWIVADAPLVLAAPVFGGMLGLDRAALYNVSLSLLIGTPALTFLGAIGASLTASLRRGGLLAAILMLPLATPVLIFGVSAAQSATASAASGREPWLILVALTLASGAMAPFAAAMALRYLRE